MFYKALTPVHYNNKKYQAGEILDIPDEFEMLDVLLKQKRIEPTELPTPTLTQSVPVSKPVVTAPVAPVIPTKKQDDSSTTA